LILDCTDNAQTRYLLNDACVAYDKVLLSGAAIRMDGQVVFWNLPSADGKNRGPCYRCVFPEVATSDQSAQNCEDEGVLGSVTGVIGTLMASEALKFVVGLHGKSASSQYRTIMAFSNTRNFGDRSSTRTDALLRIVESSI